MEQGRIIMPFEGWLPLAMGAPISESESWVIFLVLEESSFSIRSLRPETPSSSARTRSEFSEATK
jgi:hypothetical protein